jgi:hypothetical protein
MTMFTGNEGEDFPLETAAVWTENWRNQYPDATRAFVYGREWLLDILGQDDCVGIRIYYALDENGDNKLILVGVNEDGDDQYEELIVERGSPCPPYCDSGASPLNTNQK